MNIISDKDVKIRKPRRCSGCYRKFEIGTVMRRQVNDYDGIGSFYTCATCTELMELRFGFDDYDNIYPEGFVAEGLERNQTPEQLLEQLKRTNPDCIRT